MNLSVKTLVGGIRRMAVAAIRVGMARVGMDTMICRTGGLGEAERSQQGTIEGMVSSGNRRKRTNGSSRLSITEVSQWKTANI